VYGASPTAFASAPADQSESMPATETEPREASTTNDSTERTDRKTSYTLNTTAIDQTEAKQINQTLGTFYQSLPENRSQRVAQTNQLAAKICRRGRPIEPATADRLGTSVTRTDQLDQTAQSLASTYNVQIDSDRVRQRLREADQGDYKPLVAIYNQYYRAACNVDGDRQETITDFYQMSAALGVELMFVQNGANYTVESEAPRTDVQARALEALHKRFGEDQVKLWLAEIHWASRGDLREVTEYVRDQYRASTLRQEGEINRTRLRAQIAALNARLSDQQLSEDEIKRLLEQTEDSEQVACIVTQQSDWDEFASQLVEITADSEVTAAELDSLPNEPQQDITECLQTD